MYYVYNKYFVFKIFIINILFLNQKLKIKNQKLKIKIQIQIEQSISSFELSLIMLVGQVFVVTTLES